MCSGCFETPPEEVEPTSSISSSMNRRDFLRLSGTGLAGAILLGSTSGRVLAQASAHTAQGGADYGRAVWRPASRGNYTQANRGAGWIKYIIIHIAQGSYSGTIDWFQNPRSNVSAHYVVGRKGRIAQCVHNEDIAWQAGNWRFSRRSIGIEHAGYASQRWTDQMYHSSARLTAYLCRRFNIPVWRRYIRGHRSVPGVDTRCPGRRFNKDRYLRLVRHYM